MLRVHGELSRGGHLRARRHVLRSGGAPWVLLHREVIEFRLCPSPPMPPPVPEASPPPHRAAPPPPPPPPPPPAPLPKRPAAEAAAATARRAAVRCDRPSAEGDPRPACLVHDPRARRVRPRVPVRALRTLPHLTPPRPGYITSSVQRDATDGTCRYVVTYVPHGCAGVYLLAVTYAARPVRGSPFRVVVSPAGRTLGARPATAPVACAGGGAGSRARRPGGRAPHSARRPRRRRVRHSRGRWRLCDCILRSVCPTGRRRRLPGHSTSPAARAPRCVGRHTGALPWLGRSSQ